MINYFFRQYFRSFYRNKTSFFINLIGLSTGLTCSILIFLWAKDELNMDKFHEKDSPLFQVMIKLPRLNDTIVQENTQGLLAQSLTDEFPEIENAVSVIPPNWYRTPGIISYNGKQIKIKEQYAGKDYFKMFSFDLLNGDKNTVLDDKNGVLLSDELASKLFNSTDNIIGKTIEWIRDSKDNELSKTYTVNGVFKKPNKNSSLQFDAIFSYAAFFESRKRDMESWNNHNPHTYITLHKGANVEHFNEKIKGYIRTKIENTHQSLFIRPFSEKYLYGNYENGVQAGGRIEYVKLFTWVAIFILIIACINFMNMSTALASKKTKEVGIKKVIGAGKRSLVLHFMGESLIIVLISFLMAIGLVFLLLPGFNTFTGKQLSLDFGVANFLFLFLLIVFTAIISGSYPSLYLSKFNPVMVLKGKLSTTFGESFVRRGLVIFQFSISIVLILSSMVIYRQIKYIQTKNLGYNRSGIIYLKKDSNLEENSNAFLSEIKNISGVINASSSGTDLTGYHGRTTSRISYEGNEEVLISFDCMSISYDFIETLGMKMKEGRSFSKDYGAERSKIIFNESAIKKMGIKQPIGKSVHFWNRDWEIIGIVKDFNLESLHNKINPFFFQLIPPEVQGNNIWINIQAGAEKPTLNQIKEVYAKFNPGLPFEFSFFDDDYQKMYKSENQIAVLSKYFSGIAILISCLGIFGLAAFTIRKRTKEIGIRKVNGSTAFGIVKMITGDFVTLVIISLIFALPLGYIINNQWLSNFAYRTDMKWWIFAGSGMIALMIAIVTVGVHALKAANINPAICLKDE